MSLEDQSLPQTLLEEGHSASSMIKSFVLGEPAFSRLDELRQKGWLNPRGDEHFQKQRHRADNTGKGGQYILYNMMQSIGDELEASTGALTSVLRGDNVQVLDLCMAPGGFTASALKYYPQAEAFGISLPRSMGGHELLVKIAAQNVRFVDITMLAKEFGVDEIPITHPEHAKFLEERPFYGQAFRLVFCDGQVLRTHSRADYRERLEATRLNVAQLILALQRIEEGGTLIMLLHKVEAWHTTDLLYRFSQFSSVRLFKPKKKHAIRSSFYLVAEDVQPGCIAAKEAIGVWKSAWYRATFSGDVGTGDAPLVPDTQCVNTLLEGFGRTLLALGKPVW